MSFSIEGLSSAVRLPDYTVYDLAFYIEIFIVKLYGFRIENVSFYANVWHCLFYEKDFYGFVRHIHLRK